MSDGVKIWIEWEVVDLPGQGCDAMERERGSKAVSRPGEGRMRLQANSGWGKHAF